MFNKWVEVSWYGSVITGLSFWSVTREEPRPTAIQEVDNAIHWMNLYPVDEAIGFHNLFTG